MAFTRNKHLNYLLVIGVLVGIIILQRQCGVDKNCPKVTSDTVFVEVPVKGSFKSDSVPLSKKKPFKPRTEVVIAIETIEKDSALKPVAELARECLDTNVYAQEFTDTNITALVKAEVTGNKVIGLQFDYRFNKSTTTITNTIEKPRFKLFAGLSAGGSSQSLSFRPSLAILTKGDHLYTLSNDVFGMQPNLSAGVFWKLSFRRR